MTTPEFDCGGPSGPEAVDQIAGAIRLGNFRARYWPEDADGTAKLVEAIKASGTDPAHVVEYRPKD